MTQTQHTQPLYQRLAILIDWQPCGDFGIQKAAEIKQLQDLLPSGSGIDTGTTIDVDASRPDCLVLECSFHHLNDVGMYDGWTEHTITIRPSLAWGFTLRISGRNRNEIKDYLHDVYTEALRQPVPMYPSLESLGIASAAS